MPTSGSTDFSVTRNNLIDAALRVSGVLDPESGTPTTSQYTFGAEALNMLVKAWHADGMPLWAIKSKTQALTASTNSYTVTTMGISRPIRIMEAYLHDTSTNSDIQMSVLTREEWIRLGNKVTGTGSPIQWYYDPQLTNALATLYLFPTPDTVAATNKQVIFYYQRPFEDFDASSDTPDFPQEWYLALKWALATECAHEYGVENMRLQIIANRATLLHQDVLSMGQEEGSVYIVPDYRMYQGR